MLVQETHLDVVTNNLANVNTVGFRRRVPVNEEFSAHLDRIEKVSEDDEHKIVTVPPFTMNWKGRQTIGTLALANVFSESAMDTASASSVAKGETLIDTARTLDVMGTDVMILRHPMTGAPHLMAKHVKASVINAGDGTNEHPTQALLDMFSMEERFGSLEGLRVAIVGDVTHSRVARSNIYGLGKMGAKVIVAGPATLMPVEIESLGCEATCRVDDAVRGADVVMGLRIQLERQKKGLFPSVREYHKFFGLTEERIAMARKDALVMHPGPINRGVEIASEVADGPQSVIDGQVTNGVAVRMALLYLLTRTRAEAGA